MSDPLYRKEILRLAADANGHGRLAQPHRTGTAYNPTCGDKVTVDLALDPQGHVIAAAQEAKACVLTQASASILGERLKGATQEEVETLANEVAAMLAIEARQSCLVLRRRTTSRGLVASVVTMWHPGQLYQYTGSVGEGD